MVDLAKWVVDNFKLSGKVVVTPFRAYTNDVYKVEGSEKFVLKIYGEGWRAEAEVLWEIKLLDYLKKKDVSVAGAFAGKLGGKLFKIDIDGVRRMAVVFEWARGEKPDGPFSLEDYEKFGAATAMIHKAADDFRSNNKRPKLDVSYLLKRPLKTILRVCGNDKAGYFQRYAERLEKYIKNFETRGLDWGVVHTDVTFDNIHVTENGEIIFYDFDSGGEGWRAIDLQGWAVFDETTAPRQAAFVGGYRTVRNISDNDVIASPFLHVANEFWGVGLDLDRRIIKQGKQAIGGFISKKVEDFERFFEHLERFV